MSKVMKRIALYIAASFALAACDASEDIGAACRDMGYCYFNCGEISRDFVDGYAEESELDACYSECEMSAVEAGYSDDQLSHAGPRSIYLCDRAGYYRKDVRESSFDDVAFYWCANAILVCENEYE